MRYSNPARYVRLKTCMDACSWFYSTWKSNFQRMDVSSTNFATPFNLSRAVSSLKNPTHLKIHPFCECVPYLGRKLVDVGWIRDNWMCKLQCKLLSWYAEIETSFLPFFLKKAQLFDWRWEGTPCFSVTIRLLPLGWDATWAMGEDFCGKDCKSLQCMMLTTNCGFLVSVVVYWWGP